MSRGIVRSNRFHISRRVNFNKQIEALTTQIVDKKNENSRLKKINQGLISKFKQLASYNHDLGDEVANLDDNFFTVEQTMPENAELLKVLEHKIGKLAKESNKCRELLLSNEEFKQSAELLLKLQNKRDIIYGKVNELETGLNNNGFSCETTDKIKSEIANIKEHNRLLNEQIDLYMLLSSNSVNNETKMKLINESMEKCDQKINELNDQIQEKKTENKKISMHSMSEEMLSVSESNSTLRNSITISNYTEILDENSSNSVLNKNDAITCQGDEGNLETQEQFNNHLSNRKSNSNSANNENSMDIDITSKESENQSNKLKVCGNESIEKGNCELDEAQINYGESSNGKHSSDELDEDIKKCDKQSSTLIEVNQDVLIDELSELSRKNSNDAQISNNSSFIENVIERDKLANNNNMPTESNISDETKFENVHVSNDSQEIENDENEKPTDSSMDGKNINIKDTEDIESQNDVVCSEKSDDYNKEPKVALIQLGEDKIKNTKDNIKTSSSKKRKKKERTHEENEESKPKKVKIVKKLKTVKRKREKKELGITTNQEISDFMQKHDEDIANEIIRIQKLLEIHQANEEKLAQAKSFYHDKIRERNEMREYLKDNPLFIVKSIYPDDAQENSVQTDITNDEYLRKEAKLQQRRENMTNADVLFEQVKKIEKETNDINIQLKKIMNEGTNKESQIREIKSEYETLRIEQDLSLQTETLHRTSVDITDPVTAEINIKQNELDKLLNRSKSLEERYQELQLVRLNYQKDLEGMENRENPEIKTVIANLDIYRKKADEAKNLLKKKQKNLKIKREELEKAQSSDTITLYYDLKIKNSKLERSLNKWKFLTNDSKTTMPNIEAYSVFNYQARRKYSQEIDNLNRMKLTRNDEMLCMENYIKMCKELINAHKTNVFT